MRHLTILALASLLTACGSEFVEFDNQGGGGDGGNSAGGAPEGGSGAAVTGGGGVTSTGGNGGMGAQGGAGGGNLCTPGAKLCSGDQLLVCNGESYVLEADCTLTNGICLAARCETGLTALLRFTEGSGSSTNDESPTGISGLLSGAGWTSGWDGGNAVSFGGSDQVDFGNVLDGLSLPFSVSAWVNVPLGPTTTMTVLATNTVVAGPYAGIWLDVDPANGDTVVLAFGNALGAGPTNRHAKRSASAIPRGVWTHVAGVFTAPNVATIYIDGVDAGGAFSGTATFVGSSNAPMLVGRAYWGATAFVGGIDDIRIYDRALSPVEAVELSQP